MKADFSRREKRSTLPICLSGRRRWCRAGRPSLITPNCCEGSSTRTARHLGITERKSHQMTSETFVQLTESNAVRSSLAYASDRVGLGTFRGVLRLLALSIGPSLQCGACETAARGVLSSTPRTSTTSSRFDRCIVSLWYITCRSFAAHTPPSSNTRHP